MGGGGGRQGEVAWARRGKDGAGGGKEEWGCNKLLS